MSSRRKSDLRAQCLGTIERKAPNPKRSRLINHLVSFPHSWRPMSLQTVCTMPVKFPFTSDAELGSLTRIHDQRRLITALLFCSQMVTVRKARWKYLKTLKIAVSISDRRALNTCLPGPSHQPLTLSTTDADHGPAPASRQRSQMGRAQGQAFLVPPS